jgi:hypothetical protein
MRYRELYGPRMERLMNYGVYYWPRFSNATKDKENVGSENDEVNMMFEIYMSEDESKITDKNHVWSSIDTTNDP